MVMCAPPCDTQYDYYDGLAFSGNALVIIRGVLYLIIIVMHKKCTIPELEVDLCRCRIAVAEQGALDDE